MTDLEPATRLKALPALTKFGRYGYASEAAETIAAAFMDADSTLIDAAIEAVAAIGPEAVPVLVELCQNHRGRIRSNCAQALEKMGKDAAAAVPALLDMLAAVDVADPDKFDELEHRYLQDALEQIGPVDKSLPFLLERLDSPKPRARWLAAKLLGQLGSEATSATPALLSAFDDRDPRVRAQVGAALWMVAPEDDKIAAVLREAIRSGDAETREGIVGAICDRFTAVPNAMSLLGEALRLPSFAEGIAAFKTVPQQIAGQGTVYVIEGGPNAMASKYVVWSLQRAGANAKSLTPDLVKLLESGNEKAAAAAAQILGSIGPEAASTLPKLRSIVERRQKQGVAADDELLKAALAAIELIENPPAQPSQAAPYSAGPDPYSTSR
ncbi:MAG TPA: HEAT repeat domain-containing protein [Pirellulales bacterium]|nr:HEAT repeat domain-containing protein [Pirellulales bacterium]